MLFPAVNRIAGSLPDGALQLRIEHGALTSLLVPTPDPALVAEIASLLEGHDASEESVVYAACEQVLGEAMSRRLTREAERNRFMRTVFRGRARACTLWAMTWPGTRRRPWNGSWAGFGGCGMSDEGEIHGVCNPPVAHILS